MRQPVVAPERARADIRFLWPDLNRPGLALRSRPDASTQVASPEPAALCERIERELAAEAWRYRRVLVSGIATLAMPPMLLLLAWAGYYVLPLWIEWEPFWRDFYFPGISLFEAVAYAMLAIFVVWGYAYTLESWRTSRRLGVDYRRLRDADSGFRAKIAEEAASGAWPRTRALLEKARIFSDYRSALEVYSR